MLPPLRYATMSCDVAAAIFFFLLLLLSLRCFFIDAASPDADAIAYFRHYAIRFDYFLFDTPFSDIA